VAATIFLALAVHVVHLPVKIAVVSASLAAAIGFLILVIVIQKGASKPIGGTLLNASVGTVGFVTAGVGLFALYSLLRGPSAASYLPMLATLSSGLLILSAAKERGGPSGGAQS
jgi:hypothetical protein